MSSEVGHTCRIGEPVRRVAVKNLNKMGLPSTNSLTLVRLSRLMAGAAVEELVGEELSLHLRKTPTARALSCGEQADPSSLGTLLGNRALSGTGWGGATTITNLCWNEVSPWVKELFNKSQDVTIHHCENCRSVGVIMMA